MKLTDSDHIQAQFNKLDQTQNKWRLILVDSWITSLGGAWDLWTVTIRHSCKNINVTVSINALILVWQDGDVLIMVWKDSKAVMLVWQGTDVLSLVWEDSETLSRVWQDGGTLSLVREDADALSLVWEEGDTLRMVWQAGNTTVLCKFFVTTAVLLIRVN